MTAQPPVFLGGPHGALRWLLEEWDGDRGSLETVLQRLGRHAPAVLADLWSGRDLIREAMIPTVANLWVVGELVDEPTWAAWRYLFERVGFFADSEPARRPPVPLRLYRGATREASRNVRWTNDLANATAFADNRLDGQGQRGQVWTALVEPWRLYCCMEIVLGPFWSLDPAEHSGRLMEFVVDTRGLAIEETDRAPVLPAWAIGRDKLNARDERGNVVSRLRDLAAGLRAEWNP